MTKEEIIKALIVVQHQLLRVTISLSSPCGPKYFPFPTEEELAEHLVKRPKGHAKLIKLRDLEAREAELEEQLIEWDYIRNIFGDVHCDRDS